MSEPMEVHLRDCAESGHVAGTPNNLCLCSCHKQVFTFTVPGQPPTTNHMYAQQRGGGRYKAEGVEAYQTLAAHLTRLARPKGWTPGRRIRIDLVFWMNRGGRDADNHLKALLDSIAIALGVNDSTFLPCVAANEVDKVNPRVDVVIRNEA